LKLRKRQEKVSKGWFPTEPTLPTSLSFSVEEKKFQFNRRFYVNLAVSYVLFALLVVVPFLLGYIDSQVLGYGLAGIAYSFGLMAMVYLLNRRPDLRPRVAHVAVGVWLGLAVGVVGCMMLFGHQIIAAIGSWGLFVLMLIVLPTLGGFIGFWLQKRKFSTEHAKSLAEKGI
jgi:peptidoglycan/LPS O-acetylase OafA/YrhL